LKEFLGLNLKMVIYPSSSAGRLAIEKKEVDGRAGSYGTLKALGERGLVRFLLRGRVSEPGLENLPVDEDLTSDKIGKTLMSCFQPPIGPPVDLISLLRRLRLR